jgi:hypothetical protein
MEKIRAKPIYVTVIERRDKWHVMAKLETGRWLSVLDTHENIQKGKYFPGFTHFEEAKKVAMKWAQILKTPFKETKY